jgi:hypothetical protein
MPRFQLMSGSVKAGAGGHLLGTLGCKAAAWLLQSSRLGPAPGLSSAWNRVWRLSFALLTRIRSERVLLVGHPGGAHMDNTTLLIIIVLVLLLVGGGYYGRGRWW